MGDLKKGLKNIGNFGKKSLDFTKKAYTGGFIKDAFGGGGDGGAKNVNQLASEATADQARLYGQQTMAGQKALNAIKPAYAAARSNVQVGKNAALERAAQTGQQNQSAIEQSITARGLRNSSIFDNARLGIAAQNTQRFADIDADYAQMLAQLDIGEGQATAQAQQFMSGTYGQQAHGAAGLKMQQAGLAADLYEDPDAWLDSIFGIAGTAIGVGIGKNI